MSACAQDGNFQNFPLAFAVVDSENDASWEWFLTQLKGFVFDSGHLVFVSDRHGSIYNAIGTVRSIYYIPFYKHAYYSFIKVTGIL